MNAARSRCNRHSTDESRRHPPTSADPLEAVRDRFVSPSVILLLALCLPLSACTRDSADGPSGTSGVSQSPTMTSVVGARVPEAIARGIAARVARAVALALADSAVRADVYTSIHSSPYREHKIHFRSFLTNTGLWAGRQGRLLPRLLADREVGSSQAQILSALDSLRDLELYVPVPEHYRLWNGDENVVVATELRDHEVPIAFDLSGVLYPLASADVPPSIPVIGIVPAETNFEHAPAPSLTDPACDPNTAIIPCDPPPGGSSGYPQPTALGLWVNHSYIPDDFEGFLNGAPEFEIFIASQTTNSGGFNKEVQCAGGVADDINTNQPGNRTAEYVFDQNDPDWVGLVKIATLQQFDAAQALDSGAVVMVWEDDNTPCRIKRPSATATQWIQAASGAVNAGRAFARKKSNLLDQTLSAAALVVTVLQLLTNEMDDDFVGLVERADALGQTYTDATHAIVDKDRVIRGRLNIVKYDP